jgi:glycosyltransferase involved in cell wall biosynthesis
LRQTHGDVEVIVVDDGSRDNTGEVARRLGVPVIRQPNLGLAAARNAGVAASTGEYVAFLDADDLLLPEAASRGLDELERRPELGFVFGHHRLITFEGSFLAQWAPEPEPRDAYVALLRDNIVKMHATVLYRRRTLEHFGLFDTTLGACEDYDLYLRIARHLPIGSHSAIVAEYRRHGGNLSNSPGKMLAAALRVLEAQRPWVEGRSELVGAQLEGRERWRRYYGPALIENALRNIGMRNWKGALEDCRVLVRWHPVGALKLAQFVLEQHLPLNGIDRRRMADAWPRRSGKASTVSDIRG